MYHMILFNMKKRYLQLALIALLGGSCTQNFEEINTDPAMVKEENLNPDMLLTWSLKHSVFEYFGPSTPWSIREYAGYVAYEETGDIFLPCDCANPFNYYRRFIVNLNELIRLVSPEPRKSNQVAIARIWNAFLYQRMTDAYGDIPYSEAAKDPVNVINQPVYESQASIYTNLLNELKEAAQQLSTSADQISFGNADLIYQGDPELWRRFANSLRLRMAMRIRYADAALAGQHIQEVVTAPLLEDNSHNALLTTLPPGGSTPVGNVNPVYTSRISGSNPIRFGFAISEVMMERDDPRLPIYAVASTDGVSGYKGRPIQLEGEEERGYYNRTNTAEIGPLLTGEVADIVVMNSAEVYFLRAEAALAGLSPENAQQMYQQGIQQSMAQLGIGDEAAAYLAKPLVILAGDEEEQLKRIILQKYIAIYPNATEAWAEWRRTGYPAMWTGSMKGATNGQIPRRMTYPIDEFGKNEENLRQAIDQLPGGDTFLSKVWWDKKPGLPYTHPNQGMFPPN